ncbi:MAG: HlyD family efflux transporter periplasmic adaptor subunit [Anaerolineales bacterium]|nr:HlyD family efflux transporter periplasmic adaptor subunit [Anaerolineales bacterium]
MKKISILVITTFILTLVLSACGGAKDPEEVVLTVVPIEAVVAEGHIEPLDSLDLFFAVSGKVADIQVLEGEAVSEGQVLVRLADREQAEAALAVANLELTTVQQEYDVFIRTAGLGTANAWQAYMDAQIVRADAEEDWEDLNLDNIEDRIEDRKADVEDELEDLQDAQEEFDKYKDLEEDNNKRETARDKLEDTQEAYNEAIRRLEEETRERDEVQAALDRALAAEAEAKRKYELTAAAGGLDPDQQAVLEAKLNNARAQVAAAENTLSNYELKAPFDGTVTDINVSINEMVSPQNLAVTIADFSEWYVETSDLTELEVVKIQEGQTANIVADALPEVVMTGLVESIAQSYRSQGGDILYTVKMKILDFDEQLRWGMTVEVTFPPQD